MGRHEENTTQPGIVNYGGTNTFKNTVVNGKKVDTGEWTAVITFGHASRLEEVKLEDDADIVERTLKLRILDAEIVTGPHAEQADRARNDARAQRETAGTLLEGAFK